MTTYKPRVQGFPFLVLAYLQEHGESKNSDIREEIGYNWACQSLIYKDRAGYSFDVLLRRLVNHKLIVRTKRGYYKLA
jgi:hypothetical protein